MGSAGTVTQWMWKQLQTDQYLDEERAICQKQSLFSAEYVYRNNRGNVTIKDFAKRRFRQMYEGKAKWYPLQNS